MLTPKRRKRLYRIAAAVLVVLVAYKVIDGEQSAAWMLLLAALFGVADAHVDQS